MKVSDRIRFDRRAHSLLLDPELADVLAYVKPNAIEPLSYLFAENAAFGRIGYPGQLHFPAGAHGPRDAP